MMPEIEENPLSITSCLSNTTGRWQTAIEYEQSGLTVSPAGFASATDVLLTQPNLNSSHLFRADILHDSTKHLKTPIELERDHGLSTATEEYHKDVPSRTPETFPSFILTRTVVRKLIPRNARLDETLVQSCHIYEVGASRHLVVYRPHADSAEATPWYHPPVRALAYLYETSSSNDKEPPNASISIHVLPFEAFPPGNTIPTRLHRTLLSLLHTLTRLSKNMSRPSGNKMNFAIAPKDNIVPQHIVQNTYSRLKQAYSADLMRRWVEKTEPSKHVFEDLSIAAFLIELWRQMYGVFPASERSTATTSKPFPGFVDIACGNGVLVYVLRKEGYEGWGLDARRRRTWEVLPGEVQEYLLERVLVPAPYLRAMLQLTDQGNTDAEYHQQLKHSLTGLEYHDGIFKAGTFIISNHADELTPWTPILATVSHPADPLPWLAIPCCSHALSGAKYRYPVPKPTLQPENHTSTRTLTGTDTHYPLDSTMNQNLDSNDGLNNGKQCRPPPDTSITCTEEDEQPASGDLKALRATKAKAASGADQTSMYACLTAKVIALAEELGIETERTLMRIPSTRNIGIIGGRRRVVQRLCSRSATQGGELEERVVLSPLQNGVGEMDLNSEASASSPGDATGFDNAQHEDSGMVVRSEDIVLSRIDELIERECKMSGGVAAAVQLWIERAKSLQTGQGRGKLNAGKAHG
jgi:tRNASer (uridine44-2'-O)-methyltransferase